MQEPANLEHSGSSVSTKPPKLPYGQGNEALSMHAEIGNFNPYASQAYTALISHFGTTIRLKELRGIIDALIAFLAQEKKIVLPPLSRNTKRSYTLLIKYIQDNYLVLVPWFRHITLYDETEQTIKLFDAPMYNPSELP